MSERIRLLIVDDHPISRSGLIGYIQAYGPPFEVVGEAGELDEALNMFLSLRPDVVVCDLMFSGQTLNGIDFIKTLLLQEPDAKIIITTWLGNRNFMVRAQEAGATGFVFKESKCQEYIDVIEMASRGRSSFPLEVGTRAWKWDSLTPREKVVMPYIAKGLTSKGIARELSQKEAPNIVGERTIDNHKGHIRQKFDLHSAAALIALAIEYCQVYRIDYR